MPKRLLKRRYWERIQEYRGRRGRGAISSWDANIPPPFIDYWKEVPGTFPEKLVFAELVRRKVNFVFAGYMGDLPITPGDTERMRPDFYLPDYKLIIEVYGLYWHSRAESFESDAYRAMLLMASGFNYYVLPDFAVIQNVHDAVDTIPELRAPLIHGNMHMVGDRPANPTASLAARMRKYPKTGSIHWVGQHGKKGIRTDWHTGYTYAAEPPPEMFPALLEITPKLREAAGEWRQAWLRWLEQYEWWLDEYEEWKEAYHEFFGVYP